MTYFLIVTPQTLQLLHESKDLDPFVPTTCPQALNTVRDTGIPDSCAVALKKYVNEWLDTLEKANRRKLLS